MKWNRQNILLFIWLIKPSWPLVALFPKNKTCNDMFSQESNLCLNIWKSTKISSAWRVIQYGYFIIWYIVNSVETKVYGNWKASYCSISKAKILHTHTVKKTTTSERCLFTLRHCCSIMHHKTSNSQFISRSHFIEKGNRKCPQWSETKLSQHTVIIQ